MSTTPRQRRRTLPIVLGILLVLLAFGGVVLIGRFVGNGASLTKVSIVVAAHDIKTARQLTADDLTFGQVDTAPTGAFTDRSIPVGRVARQDIKQGDPVIDTQLALPAPQTAAKLYFTLPAGMVAINIPAGDISPYVQPGDQIDVIATPRGGAAIQTKTTLKGLRVLAVGTPGTPTAGNLVVEASLADAEALQFLVKNTDFTYVLKSPLDAGATDPSTTGIDLPTFKQRYGFK